MKFIGRTTEQKEMTNLILSEETKKVIPSLNANTKIVQ